MTTRSTKKGDSDVTSMLTAISEGAQLADRTHRSVDLFSHVYEYSLTRFASAERKNGGMFVQSEKFIEEHGRQRDQLAIYGQESNATTRRLAVMNLAIRGFSADFGPEHADTFRRDLIDRVHRELTDADRQKIITTYHHWHSARLSPSPLAGEGRGEGASYADIAGFCKSATSAEIAVHGHVLTPGRYVGAEEIEDDRDPFEEKMPRLVAELPAKVCYSRQARP